MPAQRQGNLPLEVGAAYVAAAARVGAWAIVSALVWRRFGAEAFALLALVRGTVALLNYTTFGLSPAMIRLKAIWDADARRHAMGFVALPTGQPALVPPLLGYNTAGAPPRPAAADYSPVLFFNGAIISLLTLALAGAVGVAYRSAVPYVHSVPPAFLQQAGWLAIFFAVGSACRLGSESAGAILQTHGHIFLDNLIQACAEIAWVAITALLLRSPAATVAHAGTAFFYAGLFLLLVRFGAATRMVAPSLQRPSRAVLLWLLKYGTIVTLGSLADFMYGPTASILINWMRPATDLAAYSAAIQIDAALLLLVTGLAAVMLPRAAAAVGRHDWATVRRYYVLGTIASAAILVLAAALTWIFAPVILRVWLKNPPAGTALILPLVLMHNVIGGSSHVGRAVILALGKARAFTASLLIAGASNAILAFVLLKFTGLGLKAVPLATILVVTGRGALWTPWYVLRCLRQAQQAH